jgi:peptidyl-tRNA hydrolase, PTH1 family
VDEPWLIAGLGNPGARYANTRHNLGWMALDVLTARFGVRLKKQRFSGVEAAEARAPSGSALLLVRAPVAYMNESGPPIAAFAKRRHVPVDRVVVMHDELDLPAGALRLKRGGSTAGHRGVKSVGEAFRSPDFYRVRIGIGRPPGRQDPADFVLDQIPSRLREDIDVLVEEAADAALALVSDGLEQAQQQFNRTPRTR